MANRDSLSPVNRVVAFVLAVVWLGAGGVALVFGLGRGQLVMAVVAMAAIVYGFLWLRVAQRSRLITWRELFVPWRT